MYLGAPVFLFFAYFVRYELAVPAILLFLVMMYRADQGLRWPTQKINCGLLSGLFAIAAIWVFLSGGLGIFYQNGDWSKHHAILNFLSRQSWPPSSPYGVHRYYLGWYLVPALAMKLTNGHGGNLFGSLWTTIGVTIFFWLIAPQFKTKVKAFIGALIFTLFSGADICGTWVTNYVRGNTMHFEWWSGWIEYSSTTTSLFWVQQHALPAWIGVALLLRQNNRGELDRSVILLFIFVGFWSPFVAVGLAPFVLVMSLRLGLRKVLLNWQDGLVIALIGLPIVFYLLTDAASVPHGLIWENRCVSPGGPCFSWPGLIIFLALEIGGAALVMLLCRVNLPESFLTTALVTLTLIPFYLIGINNDFAMRASLPAIAILALTCSSALTIAKWPRLVIPLSVLIIGLATPVSEVYRGLFISRIDFGRYTFRDALAGIEEKKSQYFSTSKIWVLRSNSEK